MSELAVQDRILLAKDRLEFVSLISSLQPQFFNPRLVRDTPDGGWTHPWLYFDSLRNYLLLTCFDLLGQPHSFKDFQSWLSARSTAGERAAALAKTGTGMEIVDIIKVVHREYLAAYGTKTSFYRFVQEVLPEAARDDLYYSVWIREIDPVRNVALRQIDNITNKIAFLYRIRNSFTHAGVNTGSPAGGVFEDHGRWVDMDGLLKKGWEPIHREKQGNLRVEYSVRDWPDALIRAVRAGLLVVSP
jgi:hypothetical protein